MYPKWTKRRPYDFTGKKITCALIANKATKVDEYDAPHFGAGSCSALNVAANFL